MADQNFKYGISEGAILRRSEDRRVLEVYRGSGEWAPYDDVQDWLTNTKVIPQPEAEAALKRFDDLGA